ncbi:hypothetical protein AB4Z43_29000 [Mesorhizobium sp. 2RAF45]|uniref:hypothetical protein n=1 Tax=Mesorhizobium sp. 2RAF45 TaxID=3233001 RepID=UPI003F9AF1A0
MTDVDNVVPFRKLLATKVPVSPADRIEQEISREETRSETVRNIRGAAENPNAPFSGRDDEIWPAQAVDRLLAQAKSRGITQRRIQERLAEKERPQRHLERLRADHTVAPAEAKKKAGAQNLIRKIEPYVAVLDVLAEALNLTPDEVVLDAFRGTAFWQSVTFAIDDPAVRLNWRLHQMVDWIIRSTRLHSYFEEVRRLRAGYDPITDEIVFRGAGPDPRPTREGLGSADFRPGDLGYEDYLDVSVPPYPAIPVIPLLRVWRVTLRGPIEVEKAALAPNECPRSEVAALCALRDRRGADRMGSTETLPARLDVFTDICLGIGPRTRRDDLGPMFEIRSHVELSVQEQACQTTTFDWSSMPFCARDDVPSGDDGPYAEIAEFAGTVAAQMPDGWRRVGRFGKYGLKTSGNHYGIDSLFGFSFDGGIQFEPLMGECSIEAAFWLLPVNSGTVERFASVLSGLRAKSPWASLPGSPEKSRWLCRLEGPHGKPAEFHFASPACQEFETALYSGAIEEALAAECHRLQRKLDECKDRTEAALRRQDDVLMARWRETQ